jgi:hypothetical protein
MFLTVHEGFPKLTVRNMRLFSNKGAPTTANTPVEVGAPNESEG